MQIIQQIPALLIVVYVCIGFGYVQTHNDCGLEKFRCYNGECIPDELVCDGRPDCRDLSDEIEAECKKLECPSYAFRCKYGACIDTNSVCDGKKDCVDNSDETLPQCPSRNTTNNQTESPTRPTIRCNANQFTCDNGKCISSDSVCDGIQECADGSDETFEICKLVYCPLSAFRCAYGACIVGDKQCNGAYDCADGSDEDSKMCSTSPRPSPLPTVQPTKLARSTPTSIPARPVTPGTNICRGPPQPLNGHWKLHRSLCSDGQECDIPEGTELVSGSYLIYSCNSGYKIIGSTDVICTFEGKWLNIPVCTEIRCKALTTASIRASCRYDDGYVSCDLPVLPRTTAHLQCQNGYLPETNRLLRGNVRCNASGHWEPEPMRCVPACGILPRDIKLRALGSVRANITEFPWHATMYRNDASGEKRFFCGASIIQENLLITAAHCVYNQNTRQLYDASSIYILTGNLFRDYNSTYHDPNFVKQNQVKRIYIQDTYLGEDGNYLSDIAILELVRPFILSSSLVPICIENRDSIGVLEPNSYGKVAGFGRTASGESSAILQALTVPVIALNECRSASKIVHAERLITNDKFCAGYTNGSSVCVGDSGGGLVFKTDLWYLRGIVSVSFGGKQDGSCNNLYSLYTDVSRYIPWIEDVMVKVYQNRTHILCSSASSTRCS